MGESVSTTLAAEILAQIAPARSQRTPRGEHHGVRDGELRFSILLDSSQRQWPRNTIASVHDQTIALVIAGFDVQYKVNPPSVRFA
jgi:hypothetical protein